MTAVDQANAPTSSSQQDPEGVVPAPAEPAPVTASASAGVPRVLVIGCVPGCGASSVAWAIATAAADTGPVLVADAASPRRSALRGLCTVGSTLALGPGIGLVDGADGPVQVRFVQADDLDARVDDQGAWDLEYAPALTVVDVGVSAEEILTGDAGEPWLTGTPAQHCTVVLVVPTSGSTDPRCEAVLTQWARRGWAPIDHVVAVGAARPAGGTAGPLLTQALAAATPLPHLEQVWTFGLPPLGAVGDTSLTHWAAAGQQVARAITGAAAPVRKRRFLRRGS